MAALSVHRAALAWRRCFTASPVSDGRHVFFTNEVGKVFVVPAADQFSTITKKALPETCMATPAIHYAMLLFRTKSRVAAIKQGAKSAGIALDSEATSRE